MITKQTNFEQYFLATFCIIPNVQVVQTGCAFLWARQATAGSCSNVGRV